MCRLHVGDWRALYSFEANNTSPDDILTDEDIVDIEQARAEFARGEAIPVSAINWD